MKKFFFMFVGFLSVCPLQAQRLNKINRAGITPHYVNSPDSLQKSDSENKRFTLCEGRNNGYSIIACFHKTESYGTYKGIYFPDGFYSVNIYDSKSTSPIESVESSKFPNDEFISLCKKYGISNFNYFLR